MASLILQKILTATIKQFTFDYGGKPLQEADDLAMTVDFSQPDNPRLGSYSLPKRIVQ